MGGAVSQCLAIRLPVLGRQGQDRGDAEAEEGRASSSRSSGQPAHIHSQPVHLQLQMAPRTRPDATRPAATRRCHNRSRAAADSSGTTRENGFEAHSRGACIPPGREGPAWATVVRHGPEEVAGSSGLGNEARQAIQLEVGQGGGPTTSNSKSRTHRRAGLVGRGDAHEQQGTAGCLPAALLLNSLVSPAEPVAQLSSGAGRLLQPPPAGHQSAVPPLQGAGHASSLPPVGHKLMAHLHNRRSTPRCASDRDGPGPEATGLAVLAEAVGAAGGGSNGGQGLALCKVQHPWSGPAGTAGSSLARKREAAAAAVAKLHHSAEAAHNSAVKAVAAWTASRHHGKVKGKPADGAKPLERKDVSAMKCPGTTASLSYKAALLAQRRSTPGVIARHHPA
ncbi:hypothetical protein HaLaN_23116 [Haematococcus lacustris]|uniref:Uncharacterized protein n=1 Tax=Haematococcus lacustris TaxID=44745 RepID=A0A699ZVJ1_HAELA|nr:hypothetical protein HaLaN_23116 [Haematococcus lacustris]